MLGFDRTAHLRSLVEPELAALAEHTGESCGLAVPAGDQMLCVVDIPCHNLVQIRDFTGTRLPLHAVATGLVVLAHWADSAIDRHLAGTLERLTPATITGKRLVRTRLDDIRRDGYSCTVDEFAAGVATVAAPLLDHHGDPVGALYCHGPTDRFDAASRDDAAGAVRAAAARVSGELGNDSLSE